METMEWHSIPELESILSCGATQLIKLIKDNDLPLHVKPNSWYAHLWGYTRNHSDELDTNFIELDKKAIQHDNLIEFDHERFQLSSDISKPARPTEPLALSKRNIEVLATKGTISEDIFIVNDTVNSDGSIVAYYKLCDPKDYKKNFVASISLEDLVIGNDYVEKLKKIVAVTPITKPISDNQKNKLHRMIGLLALLISKKAPKYSNDGKPNFTNISEDLLKELKEIDKENKLETLGLSDTNLRTAMSDGIKLLYGKKI
jgi:hypothetical protein